MEEPLKVALLVDKVVGTTGPHRHVEETIKALAGRGDVRLKVICGSHDADDPVWRRVEVASGFHPHSAARIFANCRTVWRELRGCDLVYLPTGLKSLLYAWALKGHRPLVAGPNVTGIPLLMHKYNPSSLMTVGMCDAWIEMSELRVRRCLAGGTPAEAIHLVPHCVDAEKFSPRFRDRNVWLKHGIAGAGPVLVYAGRIHPWKGIPQLLAAFDRIRSVHGEAVLALIGPVQMDLAPFLPAAGVRVLGPKAGQEFATLLASADLFVGCSRYETFWYPPLEAMSCGLPVVVSEVGAVATFIPENGVQGIRLPLVLDWSSQLPEKARRSSNPELFLSGYRFVDDAPSILADAVLSLLADGERMRAMGEAARSYVCGEFGSDGLAAKLVAVFHAALRKEGLRPAPERCPDSRSKRT